MPCCPVWSSALSNPSLTPLPPKKQSEARQAIGIKFKFVEDACRAFVFSRDLAHRKNGRFECYLMPPNYEPPGFSDRDRDRDRGGRDRDRDRERDRDRDRGRPMPFPDQGPGGKRPRY